ncbi:MAG TPA: aminopeptidase [Gammaproteobacteria bacterium]
MRVLLKLVGLLALGSTVVSCAVPFYWQAINGQWELLRKRIPIAEVLADPNQDEHVKAMLGKVPEIRRFAVEELGLPRNESYTTYVDLGRPYVVWNVIATEEFSVYPKRWCYPFTGCVAYRGFFDRDSAERFAKALERDGLDVYLGGATAYSTLGYFADPILNTMIGGGVEHIASILFHELAHQKLYIKDDSALSEAFATAVEEYGTERWLETYGDSQTLELYRMKTLHRAEFAALVQRQQNRLREIFSRRDSPEAMRAAKAEAYELMRDEYEALKEAWGGVSDYDRWFDLELNNAALAAVATYRRWLPTLKFRLQQTGPESFYAEMQELATMTSIGRQLVLEGWQAEQDRMLADT